MNFEKFVANFLTILLIIVLLCLLGLWMVDIVSDDYTKTACVAAGYDGGYNMIFSGENICVIEHDDELVPFPKGTPIK